MPAAPELSAFDIAVVLLYFAGVLAHGVWVGRGEEDAEDYFLAGRALPWWLIGFSLFASNMSGASFVGLMGASYAQGMTVFNYEWTAALVLIVFALVMLPVFLRARLFTLPEYLERRYDRRARYAYSAFTLLAILFIDMAGALYAGGVVITAAFPMLDLWTASAILAAVTGVYTIFGGLKAVVVTDTVQAILIIIGSALILFLGLDAVGGWAGLTARLEPERLSLIRPADDAFLPWPGILGVILLGFYYWTLNQYLVQRALGAESLEAGRKGCLFAGLLKLPNLFLMIIPGLIALALWPELDNPDLVFPTLAFELLPIGLRGLILTALIAAIMSSLDSALNASASLATMDFVRPRRPDLSGRALLRIGRAFTAVAMVLAAVYAPLIAGFGSLFAYFQATLAYLVPPIVAVYLGGLLFRRVHSAAGFWTILSGLAIGFPLFLLKEVTGLWATLGLPDLHFTYVALFMFLLAGLLLAGIGRVAGPERKPVDAFVLNRADLPAAPDPLRPLHTDVRWQSAGLAALTAAPILWFW